MMIAIIAMPVMAAKIARNTVDTISSLLSSSSCSFGLLDRFGLVAILIVPPPVLDGCLAVLPLIEPALG